MKRRGDDTASISLSSPTGGSGVRADYDCQQVDFRTKPENGHALENDLHTRRDQLTSRGGAPEIISKSQKQKSNMADESILKKSLLVMDPSSQVWSGPEDNSSGPHESLTESSTITFVDAYTTDESVENHSLRGAEMIYLKEFVLIDDDEDGDMSLREKTVTDLSIMDGKAAELVCGRLLSTSSGSMSECKDEASAPEAVPAEQAEVEHKNKSCCFCTLL